MSFEQEIFWLKRHMPRTNAVLNHLGRCQGTRLAVSTHLDIKMIPFYEGFLEQGGELFLTTCNPTTVRDEVVAYLVSKGAQAHAWKNMSDKDWQHSFHAALEWQPNYLCEFGGALCQLSHQTGQTAGIKAALEGTGSGVNRILPLDLSYPVFNWDDLAAKEGLHNRHMVGLTTWHVFMERTRLSLHEKKVLVIGGGLVGQGVAVSARAFGGQVMMAEVDPSRRLMANYEGWTTLPLEEALPQADVVVTATGVAGVVTFELLTQLKDGAFVLNVGHVSDEIDTRELDPSQAIERMPEVFEYQLGERCFYLLSHGAMFNLTAGYGDSINAFDVSLALMAAGVKHLLHEGAAWKAGLHLLPESAWQPVL